MSSVQKINDELFVYVNEEVGSGTFGMVFKGMYKNEACAIKMLHHVATPLKINFPVGQGQQNAIRAFDHESMVLESFQHPNVLQHLATTEHPSGNIMLVTELMDCNLSIYLSTHDHSSSLTSQCEISLSKDLASGLAYIHSRKIIHRDLCGVNVLLKQSRPFPVAKISDFGMSKLLDPSKFNTTISHRLGYLPPEALHEDDEDYDETLDVFSLGVIMIQIACRLENVKSVRERSSYLSEIKAGTHLLKLHIMTCLQDKRPSAAVVCGQLEKHLLYGDAYRQVTLATVCW
ncbi:probable serine/threonine-protein kinase kinY isoform X1 [Halichondria panicea]|uniref:probable serine/threonine-protein kinase kinY isoform X1 n=1 Tax=Halichondria panicea TaxID=6063 RepID=UPI00312B53FC